MRALRPVRGTKDLLPEESRRHRHVVDTAWRVAERYGFREIGVPIFEFTEVFRRTLGETSDVVTKEMYSFTDRGGDEITLRPEATAGIVRALISGGLAQDLPLKLFTSGPMFRYERPQKGRLRQFHQIDVELLGVPEPLGDVEVIAVGARILDALGLLGRTTLELNTLGDGESRRRYREALVGYLGARLDRLSEDSRGRLERNPLRVLDSKDERDREVVREAPLYTEYLNEGSRAFFDTVKAGLESIGIAYTVNARLVRGLDYYCHTAFEFTTTHLGAQGAVMAGGRYDGLSESMGGPPVPGVGWAAGVERLAMLIDALEAPARPITVVPVGAAAEARALVIAEELRREGHSVELTYRGNLSKRLKRADKVNARLAVLIGEDELSRGVATVRDLDSGAQSEVALASLGARVRECD
ncbi:MAG: histidine--tRNA ligase [Alphaproteobacteria bacterium]